METSPMSPPSPPRNLRLVKKQSPPEETASTIHESGPFLLVVSPPAPATQRLSVAATSTRSDKSQRRFTLPIFRKDHHRNDDDMPVPEGPLMIPDNKESRKKKQRASIIGWVRPKSNEKYSQDGSQNSSSNNEGCSLTCTPSIRKSNTTNNNDKNHTTKIQPPGFLRILQHTNTKAQSQQKIQHEKRETLRQERRMRFMKDEGLSPQAREIQQSLIDKPKSSPNRKSSNEHNQQSPKRENSKQKTKTQNKGIGQCKSGSWEKSPHPADGSVSSNASSAIGATKKKQKNGTAAALPISPIAMSGNDRINNSIHHTSPTTTYDNHPKSDSKCRPRQPVDVVIHGPSYSRPTSSFLIKQQQIAQQHDSSSRRSMQRVEMPVSDRCIVRQCNSFPEDPLPADNGGSTSRSTDKLKQVTPLKIPEKRDLVSQCKTQLSQWTAKTEKDLVEDVSKVSSTKDDLKEARNTKIRESMATSIFREQQSGDDKGGKDENHSPKGDHHSPKGDHYSPKGDNWAGVYTYFCSFDDKSKNSDGKDCDESDGDSADNLLRSNWPPSQEEFLILPVTSGLNDPESVYGTLASFEEDEESFRPNTFNVYWSSNPAIIRSDDLESNDSIPYQIFAMEAQTDEEFWNRSAIRAPGSLYAGMATLELIRYASSIVRHYMATLTLQRWWVRVLEKRFTRKRLTPNETKEATSRHGAAVLLQQRWRKSRGPYKSVHTDECVQLDVKSTNTAVQVAPATASALIVQKWWRRKSRNLALNRATHAAIIIQDWARGITEKYRPTEVAALRIQHAATVIQKCWRSTIAKHQTKEGAALKIQKWWADLLVMTQRKDNAALTLQHWWRRENSTQKKRCGIAAQRIQLWWAQLREAKNHQERASVNTAQSLSRRQNHNLDLLSRAAETHELLEARIQDTTQKVNMSWAQLSSVQRVSAEKRQSFLSFVDELCYRQNLNIRLWKARCWHNEKILAVRVVQSWWRMVRTIRRQEGKSTQLLVSICSQTPTPTAAKTDSLTDAVLAETTKSSVAFDVVSVLKLQAWWRMYVTRRNYSQLSLVATLLPGRTMDTMLSRVHGPKLWGSKARCFLRSQTQNSQSYQSIL